MGSLNWKLLTAFEAVARHRSFTRAAEELNVQQPAVSRRVAELEADLGVALLHRKRPRATLTREGETLYRAVAGGFLQVSSAVEQVRRRPDRAAVSVDTTIGFASCYLMKRLPDFRNAHPEISVELISRDLNDTYARDTDIVVVFDHPDHLPGLRQSLVFPETMVAVARPDRAASIGDDLAALARAPLLSLTMGLHADDWRMFFEGTGLDIAPPAPPSSRKSRIVSRNGR